MVKCDCNNQFDNRNKTRQKENRSEKVYQTKTETVKGRGGNSPNLVSLVYYKMMKKSILLLIIISCAGCALGFTVFSDFRLITLIVSAIVAASALVLAIKNRKDSQ